MNQAGMILALILWSIRAEMVKGSRASKRSKSSKPSQYNTVQYNSVQSNTVQYNYEGVSDKGPPLPAWLPMQREIPRIRRGHRGSNALIPLSRLPGSPGP